MAGKGRTGSLISCYLLFCGAFKNYDQAIKYYKEKRYEAVTIDSWESLTLDKEDMWSTFKIY